MDHDPIDAKMFRVDSGNGTPQLGLSREGEVALIVDLVVEGFPQVLANYRPLGGARPERPARAVLIQRAEGDAVSYCYPDVGTMAPHKEGDGFVYYMVLKSTNDESTQWSKLSQLPK